ncbi:MAG TPA: hypothetical protein VGO58_04460, partial [Chitinophagaceae bacterium]|nr:hypothetical protein [Chitinophagaceae bacterium]
YAVTTSVYILHILCYPGGWVIGELLLKMGARFFLPPYLWFPFPIAWIALTVILASQIKKTE